MMELSNDLFVGVKKIDEQHQELVNRINAVTSMGLKAASKAEIQKTLDLLSEYIVEHFKDEEALQEQSGYPKLEEHKLMHKAYIARINELKKEFAANGPSPRFSLSLSESVISWIVKHIKFADADFGRFYNSNKC